MSPGSSPIDLFLMDRSSSPGDRYEDWPTHRPCFGDCGIIKGLVGYRLSIYIYIYFKIMGVCQKRQICVQSEVVFWVTNVCPLLSKEKTATLNPKRFSNKISDTAMPLRTMFRGSWHHQRSQWVEPLLKTQPLIYK